MSFPKVHLMTLLIFLSQSIPGTLSQAIKHDRRWEAAYLQTLTTMANVVDG